MRQLPSRPSSSRRRRRTPTFSIPWTGRWKSWVTRRQTEPNLRRGDHRQVWSLLPKWVPSNGDWSRSHWQTTWWFFVWTNEEFNATKVYRKNQLTESEAGESSCFEIFSEVWNTCLCKEAKSRVTSFKRDQYYNWQLFFYYSNWHLEMRKKNKYSNIQIKDW